MPRSNKKSAFTVTELLISVAVLTAIIGMTYSFGGSALRSLIDPRAEIFVVGEVNDTVSWLQSAITRSHETGSDFTLTVENAEPKDSLAIEWRTSGKSERWSSNRIAYRSLNYDSRNSTYTSGFQKLSPALTIAVHYADDKKDLTGWFISISVYGYVRVYRQS